MKYKSVGTIFKKGVIMKNKKELLGKLESVNRNIRNIRYTSENLIQLLLDVCTDTGGCIVHPSTVVTICEGFQSRCLVMKTHMDDLGTYIHKCSDLKLEEVEKLKDLVQQGDKVNYEIKNQVAALEYELKGITDRLFDIE